MTGTDVGRVPVDAALTFLFVPGDDERKVAKALDSDADVVIVDLEDGVASTRRHAARRVAAGRPRHRDGVILRINVAGGVPDPDDLEVVRVAGDATIMLPKADLATLDRLPPGLAVVALVETAVGLAEAGDIARHPSVIRLALGTVDLAAELRLDRRAEDEAAIAAARSQLVRDSAAAGIPAPVDGPWTDLGDLAGLEGSCARGRRFGMRGRLCVHPHQLAVVRDAYRPSADEISAASSLIRRFSSHAATAGAVADDGEMVDEAVLVQARRVLTEATPPAALEP